MVTARLVNRELDREQPRLAALGWHKPRASAGRHLPSALSGVEAVQPTATFDQAITLMALNGYSQLAVLASPRNLRGAVTWQSIAYARHANPNASFADAIVPALEARYDKELIDKLPDLEVRDFVFVRDETNTVSSASWTRYCARSLPGASPLM